VLDEAAAILEVGLMDINENEDQQEELEANAEVPELEPVLEEEGAGDDGDELVMEAELELDADLEPEEEAEAEAESGAEAEAVLLEEELEAASEPEPEAGEETPQAEGPAASDLEEELDEEVQELESLEEVDELEEEYERDDTRFKQDRYQTKTQPVEPVHDDGRAWYVVHCYSGNEDKVRHNIIQRIESMSMDDLIFDVVVPTEDEVNIKNGERQTVEKKVFPGYILVNMILTEESWYMVRNTPGVTGFVGMGNDPTPLQPEEVARILKRMESESPRINVTFRSGERVRIVDGPFEDFYGKVAEIDMERATVRVMVNFFGRETPVELDFLQVEEA
jgi:transcriptional antiterminator NusG